VVMAPALLFRNRLVEVSPHLGDFFEPVRPTELLPVAGASCAAQLAENDFGVAAQGALRRHMKADPRRRGVGLDVASAFIPSGPRAELLAAPEPKPDRQPHVGAPGERLLP